MAVRLRGTLTADEPADLAITPMRAPRVWLVAVGVVGFYVALGMWAYWPVVVSGRTHLFGVTSDSLLATWFLAWVPHALAHGLDPFFSHSMFAPAGINLAQNTEAPLLGLLAAPLSTVLGPVASANVLMVLAMPISAAAAFYALVRWSVWWPAAAIGGLIYGFSPYMVDQGLGHLVLVFAPWPPLIALTLSEIVERRGRPILLGVQLGLLVAAQFLTEPEVLTIVAVVAVVGLLGTVVAHPAGPREVLRRLAVPSIVAVTLTAIVLAYPLWMITSGPEHYTGAPQGIATIYNDLLSFVAPGPLQHVSLGLGGVGAHVLAGNPFESGGYLGIPVLVITAALAWRSRTRGRTRLALLCLFTSAVLSLGSHLSVDGHRTVVPLPFLLLAKIPLVDNLLPVRFSLVTAGCLAAVIAFGLDDLRGSRSAAVAPTSNTTRPARFASERRRIRATITMVVVLVTVVVVLLPRWPIAGQPVGTLPAAVRAAVPPGNPVALTYPYTVQPDAAALGWQFDDGFRFRLLGGYGEHPEVLQGIYYVFPARMNPDDLQRFLAVQEGFHFYGAAPDLNPALVHSTQRTLTAYGVRLVIVDRSTPGSGPVMQLFTDAMGPPTRTSGTFAVWASTGGAL